MTYPEPLQGFEAKINAYLQYLTELRVDGVDTSAREIETYLQAKVDAFSTAAVQRQRELEPEDLADILVDAPPTRNRPSLTVADYLAKLRGALYGRFAGCALGAPVELLSLEELEAFAATIGMTFPPTDYWTDAPVAYKARYKVGKGKDFTKGSMVALPPDDDIIYTIVALLALERHGAELSTAQVAQLWVELLPLECTYTAERATLENLIAGMPWDKAGQVGNPDAALIGAAIRADGWAYVYPGQPRRAAELAYRDAILTHRGSGLFSAMFFAAAIAEAFVETDIRRVFETALAFVPADSQFAATVRWALDKAPRVDGFREAHRLVGERFPGMSWVHALNNACLTIWGTFLGESDFSTGISETVAMAYDNDCTAATVGSILGARAGAQGVPERWSKPWNDTVVTYLNGLPEFKISDLLDRFAQIRSSMAGI